MILIITLKYILFKKFLTFPWKQNVSIKDHIFLIFLFFILNTHISSKYYHHIKIFYYCTNSSLFKKVQFIDQRSHTFSNFSVNSSISSHSSSYVIFVLFTIQQKWNCSIKKRLFSKFSVFQHNFFISSKFYHIKLFYKLFTF